MREDKREGAGMNGGRVDKATSRGKNIKEREKEADRNEEKKKKTYKRLNSCRASHINSPALSHDLRITVIMAIQ